MRKLKILLVGYLPPHMGGIEIGGVASLVLGWAESLSAMREFDVVLAAPITPHYADGRTCIREKGYTIMYERHEFYHLLRHHRWDRLVFPLGARVLRALNSRWFGGTTVKDLEMSRIIRDVKPDVVNIHTFFEEAQSVIRNTPSHARVITSVHGIQLNHTTLDDLPLEERNHYYRLTRDILAKSDYVAFSSSYNEEYARTNGLLDGSTNCGVLHDGVDTAFFAPSDKSAARAQLGINPSGNVVLFVGNLMPRKSCHHLIEAFSLLSPELRSTSQLIIVGTGPEGHALRTLATSLSIQDRILFVGQVTNRNEVRDWFRLADVFVLPSRSEGLAISVLEAMACGIPVVSCAPSIGVYENLVHGETCLLADYGSVSQLRTHITRILEDKAFAASISHRARDLVVNEYNWTVRAGELRDLIRGLESVAISRR